MSNTVTHPAPWTVSQAREVYNIDRWGDGYFTIAEDGRLRVRRRQDDAHEGVALDTLADDLIERGFPLPVLVRFNHILHDRVDRLCEAFHQAVDQHRYGGRYTLVYPIKVNQQRRVVTEILAHGRGRVGLEAGSKPELMAVLGLSEPGGTVVCNGYKDREYIRLALIGRKLGLDVTIVIEKLSEIDLVAEAAQSLGVTPRLGIRVRLASMGAGKWADTGGEKSKFGLSPGQLLTAMERLKSLGQLENLKLLHCHLGSQIANIRDIQRGLREVGRFYGELHRLGVHIDTVDVGGGLGVDYEGTGSRSDCSINYSVQEYANNVVRILAEVCGERRGLPHPNIITESGRALTAHHAALITNIIDHEEAPGAEPPSPPVRQDPQVLHDLWSVLDGVTRAGAVEAYHDAVYWLGEARGMYLHGVINLDQYARAERSYQAICRRVHPLLSARRSVHRDLENELHEKLAEKLFLNFSLFQSLPDAWAINQVFPIVPLHRLDEEPTSRVVLQDLTCDSDGRIDAYVDGEGVESTLPLPPYREGEPYRVGIFLVGAYQEILGDMHNLFGDTSAVNVALTDDDGYALMDLEHGDTVAELLQYVHLQPEVLRETYRRRVADAGLDARSGAAMLGELEAGLTGYSYLED